MEKLQKDANPSKISPPYSPPSTKSPTNINITTSEDPSKKLQPNHKKGHRSSQIVDRKEFIAKRKIDLNGNVYKNGYKRTVTPKTRNGGKEAGREENKGDQTPDISEIFNISNSSCQGQGHEYDRVLLSEETTSKITDLSQMSIPNLKKFAQHLGFLKDENHSPGSSKHAD